MNNEALTKFIHENQSNYSIQLKRLHAGLYNKINKLYDFNTFGQKLYHFIHGDDFGNCEICNEKCKFDGFFKGYRKRCSYSCMGKSKYDKSHDTRVCVVCNNKFMIYKIREKTTCSQKCLLILNSSPEVNEKRKKSLINAMLDKYGVPHVSKMDGFGKKVKETKLINHGNENYVNCDKIKKTKLERYGDENYTNADKIKQTKLKNYGNCNYNNRPKCANTNLLLYGVKYPIQLNTFKDKQKDTFDKKHGGIGFQSDTINAKIQKTNIKRYGYNSVMQNDVIRNRMRRTWFDHMFDILVETERLENKVKPLFNKDEYSGSNRDYKFLCLKCSSEFIGSIKAGNIPRCLKCFPILYNRSKSEIEIYEFLVSLGILESEIILNDRKVLSGFELDILIPDHNLAIEFDGIVWHSELIGNKNEKYHVTKTDICNKKGIKLIHIFENEWITKKDIVKSKIRYAVKSNSETSIFARKCNIKEIDRSIKKEFLDKYHIQGNDKSQISIGAYYSNNLVAVMTFGNRRIALGANGLNKNEYEMYRFCTGNIPVVGIGGKLFNYFTSHYSPEKIISYADRRWSGPSTFYEKLNFKLSGITPPNYRYFDLKSPYILYHRFNFRKSELSKKLNIYDQSLTEWENMQLNGYDRIWDCGHFKYEWKSN